MLLCFETRHDSLLWTGTFPGANPILVACILVFGLCLQLSNMEYRWVYVKKTTHQLVNLKADDKSGKTPKTHNLY
jgi:hypothetical protein